ncbi:MAG: hypothetical protein OXN92_02465 [Gammaproteobacteria bacterium]|nr:hypothetical protein [Gammaproteobacteria bacterium]
MKPLAGCHVFLSASFPSGERGREVEPYDASAVADAVTAIVRAVLLRGGKIVFGGHPTITPLVLMIGKELGVRNAVDIFQSRWFQAHMTQETQMLAELEVGTIHWTRERASLEDSLAEMRTKMLNHAALAGAIFVGGMSGIWQEYDLVGNICPGVPRIPVAGPGGAAARLPRDGGDVPQKLRPHVSSRRYPFVATQIANMLVASDHPAAEK